MSVLIQFIIAFACLFSLLFSATFLWSAAAKLFDPWEREEYLGEILCEIGYALTTSAVLLVTLIHIFL